MTTGFILVMQSSFTINVDFNCSVPHLFFNSANCTADVCCPLICRSDLSTSPPSNESSGSGAGVQKYVLDVAEQENYIAGYRDTAVILATAF